MAVTPRRRDALRRGARLEQGRRLLDTAAARERHVRAAARPTRSRVSGGGPTGLVARRADAAALRAHPLRQRDLGRRHQDHGSEIGHVAMYNPEPRERRPPAAASSTTRRSPRATATRRARAATSSATSTAWRGTSATPTAARRTEPRAVRRPIADPPAAFAEPIFHPMKGPMTTQSLRGMANHGPMHWRGDRTGGNDARRQRAARQRHVRRAGRVQEVQRRRSPDLLGRDAPSSRRGDAGVHRLHPPGHAIRRTRSATSTTR